MVRSWFLMLAVALASDAGATCATAPVASLPVTIANNQLLIPANLNGSPELFALDTGAGVTVISTDAAGRLNIPHDFDHAAQLGGVGGANSVLFIAQVDTLELGHIRLSHQSLPIVDLPMRAPDGSLLAGFLGADLLHQFDVDLDIAGGHMDLWATKDCAEITPQWAAALTPVTFDLDDGNHILVPFKVDGVTLTGMLDTGASWFAMTTRAAFRAGLSPDGLDADPELHGTGVNNRAWNGHVHRFDSIKFAGASFERLPVEIVPSTGVAAYDGLAGADALIGMRLLRNSRLWISYRNRTLVFLPSQ